MTARVRYIDLDTALRIIARNGWGPVRDVGLLDSALARPASSAFGRDAYPDLASKAAALMHSIARNHALVDGNKRTALHLTELFLGANGRALTLSDDDAVFLVLDVAKGLADVPEIAARLRLTTPRQ